MRKLYTVLCLALAAIAAPRASAADQELPYDITFNSTNYSTWTSVDDGTKDNFSNQQWCWHSNNRCVWYSLPSAQTSPADDWFISPSLAISEDTQYEITYRVDRYSGDPSTFNMTLALVNGNAAPVTNLQTIDTWEWADRGKDKTVTFTATQSGDLRVGLHMGMAYSGAVVKVKFMSFSIKALSKATAPAAPTDFTATPFPNGEQKVTLDFKAPTKDAEGNDLTGNVTVKLYREDSSFEIYTSGPLAPGASGSYVDGSGYSGNTYYRAIAINDGGESVAARVDTWLGEDDPCGVTDLQVTYGDAPVITWKAPAEGQHGGWVNAGAMKYHVYRTINGNKETQVAKAISALTYTDESLDATTQANVSYRVVPRNAQFSTGLSVSTPTFNMGAQLALPFAESFAGKQYTTSPWMYETVKNADDATREPSWELISAKNMYVDATDDNQVRYF